MGTRASDFKVRCDDERGRKFARAVTLPLAAQTKGRLVRRYKRFLADVELDDGRVVTAHCADPGRMGALVTPGLSVRLSHSQNPKRKLPYTLELVRRGRVWVGVHPARANALVRRALEGGALSEFAGYTECRAEAVTESGSRLDFFLRDPRRRRSAWLEVKSVTLAEGPAGRFPDSVTARGKRHNETLASLIEPGVTSALLFVVQRSDCEWVECADEIDPHYADALRAAKARGVAVYARRAHLTPREIRLGEALPVRL